MNDEEGTSLFDDDEDGVLREETSLLGSLSNAKGTNRSASKSTVIIFFKR